MGNDFYDFYDTLIFALLREKIFDNAKNRQICWKNRQKRLALYGHENEMYNVGWEVRTLETPINKGVTSGWGSDGRIKRNVQKVELGLILV